MKSARSNHFSDAVLSLLAAMSVTMDVPFPAPAAELSAPAEQAALNLAMSMSGHLPALCAVFVLFLLLHGFNRGRERIGGRLLSLFCVLAAVIWTMARGFMIDNSLDSLLQGGGQQLKTLILFAGSFDFLQQSSRAALSFFEDALPGGSRAADGVSEKFGFRRWFLLILLFSLPTWIVCYPGYMCPDSYTQLGYYFGIYPFSAHHPPVHTLLISLPVRLGLAFGSANAGLFLVVCVQMLVFAAVFAYMLKTMRFLGAPRWLLTLSFFMIVLSPAYLVQAANINKDGPFAWSVVLFAVESIWFIRTGDAYWKQRGHVARLVLSILAAALLRNNGKHLLLVCVPVFCLYLLLRGRRTNSLKTAAGGCLFLVLPLCAAFAVQAAVVSHYAVEPGSRREMLSLPFQQTARYFFEHGDDVTEEERACIDAVIDTGTLAWDYDPMISDPVKYNFRDDCTGKDLAAYLQVWLRQGLRHPMTYVKASLNQNYPLFYPVRSRYLAHGTTESALHTHISGPLGLHDVDVADTPETWMRAADYLLEELPFPGVTTNMAFCTLLLLTLTCGALERRRGTFLLCALLMLLIVGTVILAPTADPRYALPMTCSMPLLTAFYMRLAADAKEQIAAEA